MAAYGINTDTERNEDQSLMCNNHKDQELVFFCIDCDSLICIDCITSTHRRHDCVKVKDIIDTEKHKLQQLVTHLNESDIPKIEAKVKEVKCKRKENQIKGEIVDNDINSYAFKVINKINEVREKYETQNKTLVEKNDKILKRMEEDLLEDLTLLKSFCEGKDRDDLEKSEGQHELKMTKDTSTYILDHNKKEDEVANLSEKVKSSQDYSDPLFEGQGQGCIQGTDSYIIKTRIQLSSLLEKMKLPKDEDTLNIKMLQFIPGDIENDLGKLLGKLEDEHEKSSDYVGAEPSSETTWLTKVISSFQFEENRILSIRPSYDSKTAWINHYHGNEEVLHLVGSLGSKVKTHKLDFYVQNLFVASSNEIYISAFTKKAILKIKLDISKEALVMSTEPLSPLGIHVTKGKEIIVCLVDERSYSIKPTSQRCIRKISKSGKMIQQKEFCADNSRLFTQPYRVYENPVTKDICVVDRLAQRSGQLTILDEAGHFKLSYKGQKDKCFNPMDVVCDDQGQIIIADDRNRLHLLDSTGSFISYLVTDKGDLTEPHALGLDNQGNLWVGCWTGKVVILDYKYLCT